MRHFLIFLAALLAGTTIFGKMNNVELMRHKHAHISRILASPRKAIRRLNLASLTNDQAALAIDRMSLRITDGSKKKYAEFAGRPIDHVDYYSSRCAGDPGHTKGIMDKQRVEALYFFAPRLFQDTSIKWRHIVQAGCQYEYQTERWFHGFVVSFSPMPDRSNFIEARYRNAEKIEYLEGDYLPEVQSFNKKGSPAPPVKFNKGSAERFKFPYKKHFKETRTGYQISFPHNDQIPAPTICDDGYLYISGGLGSNKYFSFHALNGKLKWAIKVNDSGPSTAACYGNMIVFNTYSCTLFAVNTRSGRQVWSAWLGELLLSTPTIVGNSVYVAYPSYVYEKKIKGVVPTHVLASFNVKNGKPRWQRWIDSEMMAAPVAYKKTLWFTTFSGAVYQMNQANGKILSARRMRATSAPLLYPDGIVITKRADKKGEPVKESLAAFGTDGSEQFASEAQVAAEIDRKLAGKPGYAYKAVHMEAAYVHLGQKTSGKMMAYEGSRIIPHKDKIVAVVGSQVKAFERDGGDEVWSAAVKAPTAPAAAGGYVFVGTGAGKILQIDAETGKIAKTYTVPGAVLFQPVLYKGRIYVTTNKGQLHVINTGNKKVTGWTTWGGDGRRNGLGSL